MTMDVQKMQGYEESSPDSKGTDLCIESARTRSSPKQDIFSTQIGKPSKRSFDVAFLMMPDEKFRQKQNEKQLRVSKQLFVNQEWDPHPSRKTDLVRSDYGSDDSLVEVKENPSSEKCYDERLRVNNNLSPACGDVTIDVGTDEYPGRPGYGSDSDLSDRSRSRPDSNESAARSHKYFPDSPYRQKVFDDPTIISSNAQARTRFEQINRYHYYDRINDNTPKSAFTKVPTASNYTLTSSPNLSMSPDNLLYQNSISPPLSASSSVGPPFTKSSAFSSLLPPPHSLLNGNPFFKSNNLQPMSQNYLDNSQQSRQSSAAFKNSSEYQEKSPESKPPLSPGRKFNNILPFRSDLPAYLQAGSTYPFSVQNFQSPNSDFIKFSVPPREPMNPLIANPAAAILSTLLPPTLAAFSLPAQNVCAKCNISFRMTSDLVYHMRTHHKSEVSTDPNRRKREEKLKCPVCAESFRERHHLTRHMTAHQDKEGDLDDEIPSQNYKKSKGYYNSNTVQK